MIPRAGILCFLCCACLLASAFAELTYTNATLPTDLTTKAVDVEATGSKADVRVAKFRPGGADAALPFISCTVTGGDTGTAFHWSWANGSAISPELGAVASRVPSTGTLDTMRVIGKLTFPMKVVEGVVLSVGEFKCTADGKAGQPVVFSAPVVSLGEREYRSDVEGEILAQHCSVVAHPAPIITWSKNNQSLLVATDRVKFSSDNRTLTIADLQKADAGLYICTAVNAIGTGQAYIKMRVKDRLAALWPFLGILAEVAILVVIIFLYERKRAARRRSQEAEDAAAAADAAKSSGGGVGGGGGRGGGGGGGGGRNDNDGDLRHRQVRA